VSCCAARYAYPNPDCLLLTHSCANPDDLSVADVHEQLVTALHEGQYFIARQMRVPEVFLWDLQAGYDSDDPPAGVGPGQYAINEDDHCWHEFCDVRATNELPTDEHGRTIEQFVQEVRQAAANGWQEFVPAKMGHYGLRPTEVALPAATKPPVRAELPFDASLLDTVLEVARGTLGDGNLFEWLCDQMNVRDPKLRQAMVQPLAHPASTCLHLGRGSPAQDAPSTPAPHLPRLPGKARWSRPPVLPPTLSTRSPGSGGIVRVRRCAVPSGNRRASPAGAPPLGAGRVPAAILHSAKRLSTLHVWLKPFDSPRLQRLAQTSCETLTAQQAHTLDKFRFLVEYEVVPGTL
jgi:hypothetical protein